MAVRVTSTPIDLGDNHAVHWIAWGPDRDLNPQYAGMPDIERVGARIDHLTPAGEPCSGFVGFDVAGAREVLNDNTSFWTVESWDPLTLSPSVQCRVCGDHGFVRNGRWVRA